MDENKNQRAQPSASAPAIPGGVLVKDLDGRYKMAVEGELRELDSLLSSSEVTSGLLSSSLPPDHAAGQELGFPKFTDVAPVAADEYFKEPYRKPEPLALAELHFHPDDQKELEREIEKINTLFSLAPQKKYSVSKIAQKLAEKHKLRLSDADMHAFTKTLLSFFRQARNSVQIRSVMADPKTAGGLGFPSSYADHIIAVVQHLKRSIEDSDGTVVEEEMMERPQPVSGPSMPVARPVQTIPPRVEQTTQPAQQESPKPTIPTAVQPVPLTKKPEPVQKQRAQTSTPSQKPVEKPAQASPSFFVDDLSSAGPAEQAAVRPAPMPPQPIRPVSEAPRVLRPHMPQRPTAIADVKRTDRQGKKGVLTGRIEELATMDLATWRMLDSDPRIRAGKILGKIQNLEHESLTRKSQGIDAWRSNEVYQHYLYLGQRSLEQKKNVAEVISEMQAENSPTLALDEFEAISDLNRMLRY